MVSDITLRQMEGFYLPRLIAPSIKICVERKFLFVGLYSLQVLFQVFYSTVSCFLCSRIVEDLDHLSGAHVCLRW